MLAPHLAIQRGPGAFPCCGWRPLMLQRRSGPLRESGELSLVIGREAFSRAAAARARLKQSRSSFLKRRPKAPITGRERPKPGIRPARGINGRIKRTRRAMRDAISGSHVVRFRALFDEGHLVLIARAAGRCPSRLKKVGVEAGDGGSWGATLIAGKVCSLASAG